MNMKGKLAVMVWASLSASVLMAGCSYPGDTGGFKAEQKPTKAELQQQIAALQTNTHIPPGIKSMATQKLEDQEKDAR